MATMAPEIKLPELDLRPWGLFTQVVPEHEPIVISGHDRSPLGAKWITRDAYTYGAVAMQDACAADAHDNYLANEVTLGSEDTQPFQSYNSLVCSSIGGMEWPEISAMLASDNEITRSAALVLGLTTAVAGDHINLASNSTSLGAAATVTAALALVEDGLADRIANGRGHVLMPVAMLAPAKAAGSIFMLDGQYVTAAGHKVIADAGHRPENTVYGVGALTWRMGEGRAENPEGFNPSTNEVRGTYIRWAWVAFNPNHAVRATVS